MKDMAKYIITVISDFWVSKFAQYTYYKISPVESEGGDSVGGESEGVESAGVES